MKRDKIEKKVLTILQDYLEHPKLQMDVNLFEETDIDKVEYADLIIEFEEEFEISFNDKDVWEDGNVEAGDPLLTAPRAIVDLIEANLN